MWFLLPALSLAMDLASEAEYGVCVACHGVHGEGRAELGAPRIGDLDAAYIARQLTHLHDGTRGAHPADRAAKPMVAVARGLSPDAIARLSTFVAGLDPAPLPPIDGDPAAYAPCAPCHGPLGDGNPAAQAPALRYQGPDYLRRQLLHFRDGVRGGPDGSAEGQAMAAMVQDLDEEGMNALIAAIGALRPALPPPEAPSVTVDAATGLAAFAQIYAVATSPRCMNCHPDGDAPLHTDARVVHPMAITRFSPLSGVHCSTCHAPSPIGAGQAPLPPADPVWSMPPQAMAFQNRTPAELCAQLKDPSVNGGRGLSSLAAHVQSDHLLQTSWRSGRTPPPIPHDVLVKHVNDWAAAGGPCPTDP